VKSIEYTVGEKAADEQNRKVQGIGDIAKVTGKHAKNDGSECAENNAGNQSLGGNSQVDEVIPQSVEIELDKCL
jgi:hypothetical protein